MRDLISNRSLIVLAAATDIAGPNWIVTALISAAVAGIAGFVAVHIATARFSGHSVVRVGGWLLGLLVRDENGRVLWTRPVADCMYCPPARKSMMTLQWRDNAAQFVCTTNRTQHHTDLDWTQI
ncbi:hypothetical protein HCX50_04100 [Microbacterium oxydans]|uniref:hypothetical protein n=1 Tax=Microbacterium sp. B19(2022) TaxID=2914045 RepID=UPI001431BFCE|nr:hypothetical protein [Microbacterium sp. B19(2022)]NJI58608.1 hypothetical protein [Microbacterium sp. B19(2022)]